MSDEGRPGNEPGETAESEHDTDAYLLLAKALVTEIPVAWRSEFLKRVLGGMDDAAAQLVVEKTGESLAVATWVVKAVGSMEANDLSELLQLTRDGDDALDVDNVVGKHEHDLRPVNWARFWAVASVILGIGTLLLSALGRGTALWHSRGDVVLVIVDDFSGKKGHGADVERAARGALFGKCTIKRLDLQGRRPNSLGEALDKLLAYHREYPNKRLVINFSFGRYTRNPRALRSIMALSDDCTLMIGAAGNDNKTAQMFPAGYDSVLAVSAVTSQGAKTSYSNHGDHIDMSAVPETFAETRVEEIEFHHGKGIRPYTHLIRGGTSLSAPRVAAVAASIWCIRPELTADEVKKLLLNTSDPVHATGLGKGILNRIKVQSEVLPSKWIYEKCRNVSFVAACVALFLWGLTYGLRRPRGSTGSEKAGS